MHTHSCYVERDRVEDPIEICILYCLEERARAEWIGIGNDEAGSGSWNRAKGIGAGSCLCAGGSGGTRGCARDGRVKSAR